MAMICIEDEWQQYLIENRLKNLFQRDDKNLQEKLEEIVLLDVERIGVSDAYSVIVLHRSTHYMVEVDLFLWRVISSNADVYEEDARPTNDFEYLLRKVTNVVLDFIQEKTSKII